MRRWRASKRRNSSSAVVSSSSERALVSLAWSHVLAETTRPGRTCSGMLTTFPSRSYSPATAPHSRWSHPTSAAAKSCPETPGSRWRLRLYGLGTLPVLPLENRVHACGSRLGVPGPGSAYVSCGWATTSPARSTTPAPWCGSRPVPRRLASDLPPSPTTSTRGPMRREEPRSSGASSVASQPPPDAARGHRGHLPAHQDPPGHRGAGRSDRRRDVRRPLLPRPGDREEAASVRAGTPSAQRCADLTSSGMASGMARGSRDSTRAVVPAPASALRNALVLFS